jgi:hypothetical protein
MMSVIPGNQHRTSIFKYMRCIEVTAQAAVKHHTMAIYSNDILASMRRVAMHAFTKEKMIASPHCLP